jgi:intracellular sulfur oxidation DsrE/DsrF family protein
LYFVLANPRFQNSIDMQLTTVACPVNFTKTLFMDKTNSNNHTGRRKFLGTLTTGAAAMGLAGLVSPLQQLHAAPGPTFTGNTDPDEWFKQIKGKHRIVFDATHPNSIMPFAWPRIFQLTNAATGTPEKDCSIVVILRHDAIPYAFEDRIWAKYKFSEVFKGVGDLGPGFQAADAATAVTTRNPFWKPKKGDFKVPVIGEVEIGINELQASGVMFCICNVAMTVYSGVVAMGMNMDGATVMKDWMAGLLPGIQVVPSGVWAVGRAQEHGCTYCFAG